MGDSKIIRKEYTVKPVYYSQVGAAKSVRKKWVFVITDHLIKKSMQSVLRYKQDFVKNSTEASKTGRLAALQIWFYILSFVIFIVMLYSILNMRTICSRLRKKSCGFENVCKLNDLLVTILTVISKINSLIIKTF